MALAFLVFSCSSSIFALNPSKALTQYSMTVWSQQQGLPQDTIRAITQTTDGFLWVGTDEGLARFDGYEFVAFGKAQGGLPSNSVNVLAGGPDGALWIGTPNGLTRYSHGRFQTFTQRDGLPGNPVTALFVDHSGTLWVVAAGNLSRFDGSRFTNFFPESIFQSKDEHENRTGNEEAAQRPTSFLWFLVFRERTVVMVASG
ncbi:MAG: two-component regulator propeller domain-containing protein, partial [Bryobacteraceae bacterium]